MKRILSFTVFLIVVYLIFQFVTNLLKTSHNINYVFEKDKKTYQINERYLKNKKNDYYLLTIEAQGKAFVFDVDNSFNKQKKILEDIYIYENKDIICLYPVYKNNKNSKEPLCNIDNNLYTYDIIKSTYNLDDYIEKLPNYSIKKDTNSEETRDYSDLKIYYENFYDNELLLIYNYKNLIKITKKTNDSITFANNDVYKNENGVLIDNYYVIPNYNEKGYHKSLKIIDITDKKIEEVIFDEPISSNIYINGVVDHVLYFFDKNNLKEYSLDPIKKEYKIIGTETIKGKAYIDGKWIEKSVYELNETKVIFSNKYSKTESKDENIIISDKYNYFYNSNNTLYKSYIIKPKPSIAIFNESKINEIRIANDYIYYIKNNTIYRYHKGLSTPLIERKEFQYNMQNIYNVYLTK